MTAETAQETRRERALTPGRAYIDAHGHVYLVAANGDMVDAEGRRWTNASAVRPLRELAAQRDRVVWDEWAGVIVKALAFTAAHAVLTGEPGAAVLAEDSRRALDAIEGGDDDDR